MAASDLPDDRPGGQRRRARTWIVVILVVVALVIGALTVALLVEDGSAIHDGPGTATLTWTPVVQDYSTSPFGTAPQPFSADIEGHPVSGTATIMVPGGGDGTGGSVGGRLPDGTVPAFRYRGTFAGTRFDLTVPFRVPTAADPAAAATGIRITVTGTYGDSPVRATVSAASPDGPAPTGSARFVGTIGRRKVTGTISPAAGTPSRRTVTAHFVVSG
jgi:hypothetical protein